jgi:hypothetical protein
MRLLCKFPNFLKLSEKIHSLANNNCSIVTGMLSAYMGSSNGMDRLISRAG